MPVKTQISHTPHMAVDFDLKVFGVKYSSVLRINMVFQVGLGEVVDGKSKLQSSKLHLNLRVADSHCHHLRYFDLAMKYSDLRYSDIVIKVFSNSISLF